MNNFKLSNIASLLAAISLLISFSPASANSLTINNAGFEEPDLSLEPPVVGNEVFTFTTPPGWQLYDPANLIPPNGNLTTSFVGVWKPTSAFFTNEAPEGDNIGAILLAQPPGSGIAGLSQTLSSSLEANTVYTLRVEVGNPGGFFAGFPGYRIELLAGDTVIAQDNNTLSLGEGDFATSIISFTTDANDSNLGQPLEIRLLNLLNDSGLEVDFDNVRLEAASVSDRGSIVSLFSLTILGTILTCKRKLKLTK